jgi:hypothetical protein
MNTAEFSDRGAPTAVLPTSRQLAASIMQTVEGARMSGIWNATPNVALFRRSQVAREASDFMVSVSAVRAC